MDTLRTKLHTIRKLVLLVALYIGGLIFFLNTNPASLPLVLLVVPFLWMFVTIFLSVWLLLGLYGPLRQRRRRFMASGVAATLPVLLLVFQSIHQLTARDILLSVALVAVAVFYLSRADFIR